MDFRRTGGGSVVATEYKGGNTKKLTANGRGS